MKNNIIRWTLRGAFILSFVAFVAVVIQIFVYGVLHVDMSLFDGEALNSALPAIWNTILLIVFTLVIAVPISVFSAMFLWFYGHHSRNIISLVQVLIDSLGAIPSIVYALFGMIVFVNVAGLGFSLLSGVLTMVIVILPILIRSVEQSLRAIPDEVYFSGIALGLPKMRVILFALLPAAMRGILSGIILSIGRIIGESAALIFTMGTASGLIRNFLSSGRTLSVQLYSLTTEGLYMKEAYATALILLLFVIVFNLISYFVIQKGERYE